MNYGTRAMWNERRRRGWTAGVSCPRCMKPLPLRDVTFPENCQCGEEFIDVDEVLATIGLEGQAWEFIRRSDVKSAVAR